LGKLGEKAGRNQVKQQIARRYIVKGRVQGVGYRMFVQNAAKSLDLVGHVRNLDDGSVEVLAAGPPEKMDDLLGHLQRGPRFSEVRAIEHKEAPVPQYDSFHIR
jgi:acylphosphatase